MENLLTEGRYDRVTTELSREVINAVKEGKRRYQTAIVLFKRTYVDIVVYIHRIKDLEEPQVYAGTYLNPKEIRKDFKNKRIIFHVEVPMGDEELVRSFNTLIPELKNIIRHEIEHVAQNKFKDREREGFFSSKRRYPQDLEYFEYLMEPYEVEAYVRGLYKKAKTLGQPLNTLIDDFKDYLEGTDMHPHEVKGVMDSWRAYAKKHLYQTPYRKYGYVNDTPETEEELNQFRQENEGGLDPNNI